MKCNSPGLQLIVDTHQKTNSQQKKQKFKNFFFDRQLLILKTPPTMTNCSHHGCRRILKGFQGPRRCDECSPPLTHLIPGRGSITSHTPGNNDDTDDNRNNGDDDSNSDSNRKTRSSNRRLYEKGLAQVLGLNFQKKECKA